MSELVIGDVFSISINPRKREALTVLEIKEKTVICSTGKQIQNKSKRIKGSVFLIS